ncbi:MAG: hypothetical protein WB998_03175 [Solirubrobacteraceae bacterium]
MTPPHAMRPAQIAPAQQSESPMPNLALAEQLKSPTPTAIVLDGSEDG